MKRLVLTEQFQMLRGIPVHINDVQVRRPVRQVKRRMWHRRRCYADRVDKKWLKRFGTEVGPMIRDGEVLSMPAPSMSPFKPTDGRRVLVMNSTTYLRLAEAAEPRSPTGADALAYALLAGRHGARHG